MATRSRERTHRLAIFKHSHHVKDAIITVDEHARIATANTTAQRIFGFAECDMVGQSLALLLPELNLEHVGAELERLAARLDDTQTDLAPHETVGLRESGLRFSAEMAWQNFMNRHGLL